MTPILAYPNLIDEFFLDTDASEYAIGAVLSQKQNHKERVVAYFSRTLTRSERNYCVTRRELLAVVKSIEHFNYYLHRQKFRVRTDHSALQWPMSFRELLGQLARWLEKFKFTISPWNIALDLSTKMLMLCPDDPAQKEIANNVNATKSDFHRKKWVECQTRYSSSQVKSSHVVKTVKTSKTISLRTVLIGKKGKLKVKI